MQICMRTSVALPDRLFHGVKALAAKCGTTLRELMLEGLEGVLRRTAPRDFVLDDHSFGGEGLVNDVGAGDWERIRDRIYEGRGA